jgi:hypothetical protein
MNFDPQKFFISMMDFFSVLLPGALLSYLLMGEVGPVMLGDRYARLAGAQAWAAFPCASYLLGTSSFCSAPGGMSSTTGPCATRCMRRYSISTPRSWCFQDPDNENMHIGATYECNEKHSSRE